ncbi:MAG: hypothetical protein ACYSWS_03160 [Planctomycetota bacterium]|jgi:hypothetical protein
MKPPKRSAQDSTSSNQPKRSHLDVARNLGNFAKFVIAWSKYYYLFYKIKEKYNNPPILIPEDTKHTQPDIEIPEDLKGKVRVNHEIAQYFLEATGSLSETEEKWLAVLQFRQVYGEGEWVDHNTPEPSRFTLAEIESINQEFGEVLAEVDRLWDEIKCYINDERKNVDVCRFLYRLHQTKNMLAMYEIMGGSSAIAPYEVTDYKSCKSLLGSYSYENRNTDEFRDKDTSV